MQSWFARRKPVEVSVKISDDDFIRPRDPSQRNWVVTRAMEELVDDLVHMDTVAGRFVDGTRRDRIAERWESSKADLSESQLVIDNQQVMQDWERPYMEAMAKVVAGTHGDVLEIGFGMGISASFIQELGVRSHTIVECNEDVQGSFEQWRAKYPGSDIRLLRGRWQDALEDAGEFDGIFFDSYPLSEREFQEYVVESVTFAEHFFATAAKHLRPGGVFTYYSNEIDSVSRRHQRALFRHFREVSFTVCEPLYPPKDCNYWWADSMVVTRCIK
ncbi:MAG TPA: class I SAM-dependent methyltransferase [Longimicrobium sp.]|nr:class I SAM-dependent methyltransferase [Longimicrobium sp.]